MKTEIQKYRGWILRRKKLGEWKITPPAGTNIDDSHIITRIVNQNGLADAKTLIDGVESTNKQRQEALDKGDYQSYLCWFDSHDYVAAFQAIVPRLTDQEYWTLFRAVWTMDDFNKRFHLSGDKDIWGYWDKLKKLLCSPRPCRELFTSPKDTKELLKMPEQLSIHRGYKLKKLADGYSWTTDFEKAKWFAKRFGGVFVVSGKCRKQNVIGYFTDRKESEIVIDPKNVFKKHRTTLPT